VTPSARLQVTQFDRPDPHPLQLSDRMAQRFSHLSDLAFAAFGQNDFEPGVVAFDFEALDDGSAQRFAFHFNFSTPPLGQGRGGGSAGNQNQILFFQVRARMS